MKTSLTPPKGLTVKKTRRRLTSRQRGVAIVTVLAVIVLMAALVLSFFQMAKNEQVQSKANAEILRSYSLRDIAINIAIAQIREATAPTSTSVNANRLWTSQPGMIRTFDNLGNNGPLFKLYSAKSMWVDGNVNESSMLAEDSKVAWRADTVGWVDLNQPVYRSKGTSTGTVADSTGTAKQLGTAIYPIIDPDAYKPSRANTPDDPNPEGFKYASSNLFGGVDPNAGTLPMPVRWLYTLQDGTIGYMSESGQFQTGSSGSAPSDVNPIVGRIAFWTDDESCKININTASEGVFWDTPRCDTPEERFYANCQPTTAEYQRFPGHPAGVCLSTVLFPGKRYYASGQTGPGDPDFIAPSTPVDPAYKAMTPEELRFIWDLAPFVSAKNKNKADAGSVGGLATGTKRVRRANLADPLMAIANGNEESITGNPDDHLYTSADELLFRALKTSNNSDPSQNRASWTVSRSTNSYTIPLTEDQLITRLNRSKFLLTTKSSAPEATVFGTPRVSMWPVDYRVPAIAGTGTGAIGGKYTFFDSVIGLTAQLSPTNYYYIIRNDHTSRHAEFYNGQQVHNKVLLDYLKRATDRKFPGVPGKSTFVEKYSYSDGTGQTTFSDRDNIVMNMLDYIRMTNLNDPLLSSANRYGYTAATPNIFPGQITAYCGCGGSGDHANNWAILEEPFPKGVGRMFTPNRMHWVIIKAGKINAAGTGLEATTLPAADQTRILEAARLSSGATPFSPAATIYEMGVMIEGTCPSQGLSGILPRGAVRLGGADPAAGTSNQDSPIPELYINDNSADAAGKIQKVQRKLRVRSSNPTSPTWAAFADGAAASGWPLIAPITGGSLGILAYGNRTAASNGSLIQFEPFAVAATDPAPNKIAFKASPEKASDFNDYKKYMWRLMVYDNPAQNPGTGNIVQGYYFNFGKPYAQVEFPLPTTATNATLSLNAQVAALCNPPTSGTVPVFNVAQLGGGKATIHSMYIPHGDYRGVIARRVLGPVPNTSPASELISGTTPTGFAGFWNSFIPTSGFGDSTKQYAFNAYDPVVGWIEGDGAAAAIKPRPHLAYTATSANTLPPSAAMDYPLGFDQWQHHTDAKMRKLRGSLDPSINGDFNNGIANTPDGAYINRADEGDLRPFFTQTGTAETTLSVPYFGMQPSNRTPGNPNGWPGEYTPSLPNTSAGAAAASPNRQVRSPVQMGSLATGSSTYSFWQSLLFRPDPFGGDPNAPATSNNYEWDNRHYGSNMNTNMPKDHLLLDLFWMPVVEPYSISDTFSTKGKVNMNYRIMPFNYITRATALHAVLKAEKMLTIPTQAADVYKLKQSGSTNEYSGSNALMGKPEPKNTWRKHINAELTLSQFERKFNSAGEFVNDKSKVFRTASEICDLWLIPESLKGAAKLGPDDNPYETMREFWTGIKASNSAARTIGGTSLTSKRSAITDQPGGQRLTGDNSKEAPYANIYPRLTTKSNVYKVHFTVQTIQKARSTAPDKFDPVVDKITSEYRGSAVVERALDMTNPNLKAIDYLTDTQVFSNNATGLKKRLDYFYNYRITEIKQFAP